MAALTFDDLLPEAGAQPQTSRRPGSRALTFDDLLKQPELNAEGRVGGAMFSGLVNAATGLAGLPADVLRGGQAALD